MTAAPSATGSAAAPPTTPDPAAVADVAAVTGLLVRERQSRDRERWEDMGACYAPGATIAMSWFAGPAAELIERSTAMDVGGSRGVHRLSPPAVSVRGDRAVAELPLVIELRTDVGGVEADLCSFARSQHRAVREGDAWRIAAITSVYERDTLVAAVPGTVLPVDAGTFAGLRPSYRCCVGARHMGRSGYRIPDDLPGDDRPTSVAGVMAAEEAWLTADPEPGR